LIFRILFAAACCALPATGLADATEIRAGVYSRASDLPPAQLWQRLDDALSANGFAPVSEVDAAAELARYQAWGLEVGELAGLPARSLSFSSNRYAQRLGALDHRLIEGYPLSVTVVADGVGSLVLLPRPTASELPANAVNIAATLEEALVQTVESALTVAY